MSHRSDNKMLNVSQISYPASGAQVHDPLPCWPVVFRRAFTSIDLVVCWRLVLQDWTLTTETFNHLAECFVEFDPTRDVFTTYQMSKATDSIAHSHMNDLKMQLKADHALQYVERAKHGESPPSAQWEHRNTDDTKCQQELSNSPVHDCTSFYFVRIDPMLHFEE